jgi:hypothetical protein
MGAWSTATATNQVSEEQEQEDLICTSVPLLLRGVLQEANRLFSVIDPWICLAPRAGHGWPST